MKLSTKGRYGARLMLDLAIHYGKGPVFLKDIAERQEISEKYLGHLISPLKAAGFVASTRGAHGGYFLSKVPSEITMEEIIKVTEGDLAIVGCVDTPKTCHRISLCVTRDIWKELSDKITNVLQSVTLQDMVDRYNKKQKLQPLSYSI